MWGWFCVWLHNCMYFVPVYPTEKSSLNDCFVGVASSCFIKQHYTRCAWLLFISLLSESFPRKRVCRRISESMAHVLHLLLLWLLVRSSEPQGYVGNGLGLGANIEKILPSVTHRANGSRSFYGIMFDAGSTGTRVHIYNFIQKGSSEGV